MENEAYIENINKVDPALKNKDLSPVPKSEKTWGAFDYAAIWMGIAHNINQWILAANMIILGLSFWQALAAVILAYFITYIGALLNGVAGAKYGLSFPVMIRSVFGIPASKVPIFIRAFVGVPQFGIFVYVTAKAIDGTLIAIFPAWSNLANINILGMGGDTFISYIISLLLHIYIISHGVERIRRFELWAGPSIMVVAVGLFIWGIVEAGGITPIITIPSTVSGVEFWSIFSISLTAMIGSYATLIVNITDLTRTARDQKAQVLGQGIGMPIMTVFFSVLALVATAGSYYAFGNYINDPLDIMNQFTNRWVVAFGSFIVVISTLSLNSATNAISAGFDLTALLPKVLNFKRSCYVALVIGFFAFPWKWYGEAEIMDKVFGFFGSAMGPMLGLMLVDFFIIRRTNIDVEGLYDKEGPYKYTNGWNIKALVAFGIGFFLAIIGLIIPGLSFLYNFNWFIGLIIGGVLYLVLMWPERDTDSDPVSLKKLLKS